MILERELYKIGKFQKTHALKGELNMICEIDPEYFTEGNPLIIDNEGIFVPYYILSVRPKGSTSYLVKIKGVENEKEASEFVNKEIYILKKDAEQWLEDLDETEGLLGYKVIDFETGSIIGEIEYIDNSTNNVLFIIKGQSGEEIYIPATEDFIIQIDDDNQEIKMKLPEGLIEINN